MTIKPNKGKVELALGLALVITIVFLFFSLNQKSHIIKANFDEMVSTFGLGISSTRNLIEDGTNYEILNNSSLTRLLVLIKNAPSLLHYKFFAKDKHQFEKIYIDVDFLGYQKILTDRKNALKAGLLLNPSTNSATLKFKNKTYNANIRLKGDLGDHWTSRYRMSLKIKLKNDKTMLGFSEFAIQKPKSRSHPYDYIFQSLVRGSGNLGAVNKFAHIFFNGEDWGIMNIEELMSKEFLEKQNKKESVIIRLANDDIFSYLRSSMNPYQGYRISDPSLYLHLYSRDTLKDLYTREIYSYISKNRLLNNNDLYDIDSFSKALIMSVLWNSIHSIQNSNSRYYFNPYTLKLEPITTDQGFWRPLKEGLEDDLPILYKKILANQTYLNNLPSNLQKVRVSLIDTNEHLSYIRSIFPLDQKKDLKTIKVNMTKILNNKEAFLVSPLNIISGRNTNELSDNSKILPTRQQASEFKVHIHAKHYIDGTLELFNLLPDNVTIKNILYDGDSLIDKEIIVPGYMANSQPIALKTPYKGTQDYKLNIYTEYQGYEGHTISGITLVKNEIKNPLLFNTSNKFNFINQLEKGIYEIASGNWIVDQPIIIEGNLNISPGANLRFSKDAYLVVKGSLTAIGDKYNPITLNAFSDSWKGVYVINADNKSYLKNVTINNVAALEDGLLKLTGGINFYKSDVNFENVKINNSKAEDAINIVNSSFSLKSVTINGAISDGLDSDFSRGDISNSVFFNIGGDALDFSGSNVFIDQITVANVKDKAISAGEISRLIIKNSNFKNIAIGVASKDGSIVDVFNTSIINVSTSPGMTFIKKNYYEAPTLNLTSCDIGSTKPLIAQFGTSIIKDGIEIEGQDVNVKMLYGD
jgi:hypothetical protein